MIGFRLTMGSTGRMGRQKDVGCSVEGATQQTMIKDVDACGRSALADTMVWKRLVTGHSDRLTGWTDRQAQTHRRTEQCLGRTSRRLFSQHALACRSPRINSPPPAAGRRPPAAAGRRSFYSNFDWLDYGLILLVDQCRTKNHDSLIMTH
jgi:hypothetical protein